MEKCTHATTGRLRNESGICYSSRCVGNALLTKRRSALIVFRARESRPFIFSHFLRFGFGDRFDPLSTNWGADACLAIYAYFVAQVLRVKAELKSFPANNLSPFRTLLPISSRRYSDAVHHFCSVQLPYYKSSSWNPQAEFGGFPRTPILFAICNIYTSF